jgi:hypothetical protein
MVILAACGAGKKPLAEQLAGAGLEVAGLRTLQGNELPPGAESGQQFTIPGHCANCGGKILVFRNDRDAGRMADTWRAINQHVYVKGGVLLQINGTIPVRVANQYGEVLLK